MITLEGLTPRQVELCNILWTCDTREDIEHALSNLSLEETRTAHTLIDLMIQESIEKDLASMESYPDADKVLKKILKR